MSKRKVEDREMLTRNVSLPAELDNVVQGYLNSGMYANYSEVIRNAIRVMHNSDEQQRVRLELMRQDIQFSLQQAKAGQISPVNLSRLKHEVDSGQ